MSAAQFSLPNGLRFVVDQRPQSGKVSMQIHLNTPEGEDIKENGLTYLTAKAGLEGTKSMKGDQLTEEVQLRGVDIEALPSSQLTVYHATSLARDAEAIFSIMADATRHPLLGYSEVSKARGSIKFKINQQAESAADKAGAKFAEAAFAGQAMGLNPLGTTETLDSFSARKVRKKHAELLAHPENIVISFAGDITAAQAQKMVQDYFGDLPAATAPQEKQQVSFTGGDIREANDNGQLNLEFGFEAPPMADPDRCTAFLLNEVLSGMSGPLFQEIREKRSLVYQVESRYIPRGTSGSFSISAGAGKGKAGELIEVAINDVLGKIIREGVDPVALEQARERVLRNSEARDEMAEMACLGNGMQMFAYGRTKSEEEVAEQYKQVTSDDIRRVCANMLRDGKYALSAVGPQDSLPSAEQIRDMMQAQLKGVDVPLARPERPSIKTEFNQAAAKAAPVAVEPKMTVISNGIKVVTVERPGTLVCGAWVGSGSDSETAEQNGAAHVLEHEMFKGTHTYKYGQIQKIVEGQLGGLLNAYTTKDKTAYFFFNLEPAALEKTADICGEMMFAASLSHESFDGKAVTNPDRSASREGGEREVIIEEQNRRNDKAHVALTDFMFETAYPDQPHGRPTIGTEETLRAMTVEDFKSFRDDNYVPNNMVFAAAGPVSHEDFVALIEKKYGHLPARDITPAPAPVYKGGAAFIEKPSVKMCEVTLASESVPTTDPDNIAYKALSFILGGSDTARLAQRNIFEKNRMIINLGSSEISFSNGGLFLVDGVMLPQAVKPFVADVYKLINTLTLDLTQKELDKVKVFMEMQLLSGVETNQSACDNYAGNVLASGKLVTQEELLTQIQKLTVNDIKRVARKVMATPPTLAMVVPPGTDPRFLPKQEEVVAAQTRATETQPRNRGNIFSRLLHPHIG